MNVVPLPSAEPDVSFSTFYCLYPRHEARKDAMKAWDKLTLADQLEAIIAIASWRRVFLDRGQQYTPLAATWLRGERWEDTLPPEYRPRPSHTPMPQEAPAQRTGEIPPAVRQLFAKLTGKS